MTCSKDVPYCYLLFATTLIFSGYVPQQYAQPPQPLYPCDLCKQCPVFTQTLKMAVTCAWLASHSLVSFGFCW